MKTMAAPKILHVEGGSQFVVRSLAINQSGNKLIAICVCRIDPKVDILRKCCSAIKHCGLPADQQILNFVSVKVLEKVCDHARISGRECANASASSGANARVASDA